VGHGGALVESMLFNRRVRIPLYSRLVAACIAQTLTQCRLGALLKSAIEMDKYNTICL